LLIKQQININRRRFNIDNNSDYLSDYLETVFSLIKNIEPSLKGKTVEVCIINAETMQKLNRGYFGRNVATDILSFPNDFIESDSLGEMIINNEELFKNLTKYPECSFIVKGDQSFSDMEFNGEGKVKDIEISYQQLLRLFIHGLLHLRGYDHLKTKQKKIMAKEEEKYYSWVASKLKHSVRW